MVVVVTVVVVMVAVVVVVVVVVVVAYLLKFINLSLLLIHEVAVGGGGTRTRTRAGHFYAMLYTTASIQQRKQSVELDKESLSLQRLCCVNDELTASVLIETIYK
jgi:hypothetical protein